MWTAIKSWFGWIVALILLLLGSGIAWNRKVRQKKSNDIIKQKAALERAVLEAARRNKDLDKKVRDALSHGTVADRFNK